MWYCEDQNISSHIFKGTNSYWHVSTRTFKLHIIYYSVKQTKYITLKDTIGAYRAVHRHMALLMEEYLEKN